MTLPETGPEPGRTDGFRGSALSTPRWTTQRATGDNHGGEARGSMVRSGLACGFGQGKTERMVPVSQYMTCVAVAFVFSRKVYGIRNLRTETWREQCELCEG